MGSIEIRKRERENTQAVIRRFSRAVKDSGILRKIKRRRFRVRPKSKLAKQASALRRIRRAQEQKALEKLGK
ncbi:MAG: hypothetical protein A2667_00855 [Candidatus Wildermuthbacteria bacterium RIFCSPHIGHO2_01_FULL_47_27]|uniref:30S ribosomal protein S21 n=2 Tax=Candidatus Wildermuthiibacteriota TaxID=1817923 RepID=A0A1G2RRE5_9BACT|nr:MAG: hypothetical protein A2667_00855 [Candidatus Wildermuthbacteria bacterium RIFCSPHIGHO2_01_FULL_47_27]OHA66996.1 MAG: hypothetical protein A3D59_01560 [Candidatus Wildermuthbacteria bacterium RIFCSPHIGHO2_02_FULL_47_17]OHA75378.1 MAG: hypothetical protein A3I38_01160 [Candidatus Wildermuthbacteria bacterium RIFCSPLOWO2_02_FULL_47_10]OHA75434.1 MAG: hypothetical protein A3A32_00130 [Candidatus Wildermuthbacteria bacterium RIFCSPLOWO2_01_FULL_48_35]